MANNRTHPDESESIHPLLVGLLGNLALALLKLGFGLSEYSRLVLIDGLFSLMCVTALLVPWQAEILDKQRSDERHPYGLGKLLFISMALVGLFGMVVALNMLFYSLKTWGWVGAARSTTGMAMITVISIVGNAVLYRYLMGESRRRVNVPLGMYARYNHLGFWISLFVLMLLALGSLGVLYVDRVGVAAISILVFLVGVRTLHAGFAGIMDKVPPQKVLDRITACVRKVAEVKDVVSIKARYVGTLLHIDTWIAVDENLSMEEAAGIARNVKAELLEKMPFTKEVNVIIA